MTASLQQQLAALIERSQAGTTKTEGQGQPATRPQFTTMERIAQRISEMGAAGGESTKAGNS